MAQGPPTAAMMPNLQFSCLRQDVASTILVCKSLNGGEFGIVSAFLGVGYHLVKKGVFHYHLIHFVQAVQL